MTGGRLLVGENPDVGRNACIIENVVGQLDDGIHQVILYHVAADVALAAACITREKTGAVMNGGDARTLRLLVQWLHLVHLFQHEQ